MKNGVAKVRCSCTHPMQDKMHGVGVRVANATAKQDPLFVEVRCTVCNSVQRVNPSQVK